MTKAEEIYHRFVQYEWHDVSDSLKMSIIQAINEAMGINTNEKWRVKSGIYEGHEFLGYVHSFGDTVKVIDCGTVGRSYPIEFCEKAEIYNVQPPNDMQCGVGKNNI